MVLKSIKYDRLEFETLGLERIIFARNTVEENWIKDAEKAFFDKTLMCSRAKTAQDIPRLTPMYAYALPGAHLAKYLYKMFESTRKGSIKKKHPIKKANITKFRREGQRVDIIDTFKYTYQFGVF